MRRIGAAEPYLRLSGSPRLPVVRQATATECGLACVAMLASYLGAGPDLTQLRRQFPASLKGMTLRDIVAICGALKLATRAVRCRVSELGKLRTPCLLHWRFNHFVVLKSAHRDHLVLHDPARGCVKESLAAAGDAFTGVALEVARSRGFQGSCRPRRLKLGSLIALDSETIGRFAAGLVLALVCEFLLLATPFYLQVVIDQVLGKGDWQLLGTLAAGFGLLLAFQVVANVMRQLTFQYLSQVAVFDLSARVLHSLMGRSIGWFRSRDLGDVQHRVQSLRGVQDFIVHAAPAMLLDVLFVTLISALMFVYEPAVTGLAIVAVIAWALWRYLLFPVNLRRANDIAMTESLLQTHFLETLRAAQIVKMLGGEAARESEWRNLFADTTNARIRAGNLRIVDNALRLALFQGMRVAAIYMLATRALDGQMSIGMVSAYVAYLGMFIARSSGIVEFAVAYKLLAVPLDRLADVVFGENDGTAGRRRVAAEPAPGIDLRNVTFRFVAGEAAILRCCSCRIPGGGFTAIAGSSGSGKSTLLRLIAGVEPVSEGDLCIGGVPTRELDSQEFRRRVAAVFEGDCLVKGSVVDNIALFDQHPDRARVHESAQVACVAEDIESLPMGYETRIGDLGSSLSKGQTQRILLARALYRRPVLLLLDEATSGLDSALEKRVIRSLSELEVTRVVVTHSDHMLEAAHDVLWLSNGTLLSSRPELNV